MKVHLVSVVGGDVQALPHMLAHYRSMGIESIFLNLHLSSERDPARDQVEAIASHDGCGIATITVGDWQQVQQELYLRQREQRPGDWFLLADQDELQVWPGDVREILKGCGGWDYVRGCFIDRLARDGGFPALDPGTPIWDQYPLGSAVSMALLGSDPRKVVAVKGPVPLKKGQHHAYAGRAYPSRQCYVPIHHFKWTGNVMERLEARAIALREVGAPQWAESARFVEYCRAHESRIDVNDPNLLIGECAPDYPHWEALKKFLLRAPIVL